LRPILAGGLPLAALKKLHLPFFYYNPKKNSVNHPHQIQLTFPGIDVFYPKRSLQFYFKENEK